MPESPAAGTGIGVVTVVDPVGFTVLVTGLPTVTGLPLLPAGLPVTPPPLPPMPAESVPLGPPEDIAGEPMGVTTKPPDPLGVTSRLLSGFPVAPETDPPAVGSPLADEVSETAPPTIAALAPAWSTD